MNYFKRTGLLLLITLPIVFFSGCLNDEEDYTGRITASDQIIVQNSVFVQELAIDHPGWLAIYRSIGGTPAEMIVKPVYINSRGRFTNNFVPFDSTANITDGMDLILMLHVDNGELGKFEYNQAGQFDQPVVVNETTVQDQIKINAPFVSVEDQAINDNTITIDEVQSGLRGWVAIYLVDEEGELGELAGYAAINQSPAKDIEVELDPSLTIEAGDDLAARLHVNNTDDVSADPNEFNYPDGNDDPQAFGFEEDSEIIAIFTIQ